MTTRFWKISRKSDSINPKKVAVLGPGGSFSEEVALNKFGDDVELVYTKNITKAFSLVENGKADCGIVPVETTQTIVQETLDAIERYHSIFITGEIDFEPQFYLVGKRKSGIKKIGSKLEALKACEKYLDAHFPGIPVEAMPSTSDAAERASEDPTYAAIASKRAAQIYGLKLLQSIDLAPGGIPERTQIQRIRSRYKNFNRFS